MASIGIHTLQKISPPLSMAGTEAIDIPEHFFICGICQNTLRTPKQLECLHSFCSDCINDYLHKNTAADSTGNTLCPTCHSTLHGSDHVVDDVFTNSLALLSFCDKNGVSCASHPEEQLSKFCVSCDVVLCDKCWSSTNHTQCQIDTIHLSTIDNECKKRQSEVSGNISDIKDQIDSLCQDLLSRHAEVSRAKDQVAKRIKDYFFQLRDESTRHILEQEQQIMQQLNDKFEKESGVETNKIAWCRSMLHNIDNQEEVLDRTGRMKGYSSSLGVALLQTLTEFKKQYEKCQTAIEKHMPCDISIKFTPDEVKREELMQMEYGKLEIQRTTTGTDQGATPSVNETSPVGSTDPNMHHAVQKDEEPPPPYFLYAHQSPTSEESANFPLRFARQTGLFTSKLPDDKKAGYAVGIGWVDDDRLVTADRWNRKLKLFRSDGMYFGCMSFLDGDPWDVSVIESAGPYSMMMSSRYCLVTIPKCRSIMKVMIPISNKMEIAANIRTAVGYSCIAHDQSNKKIVCGVCSPFGLPRVDIIHMNGQIFRSIAVDSIQHRPIFSYPRSVDVSEDGIITVSDWNRNRIFFLQTDGLILGSYGGSLTSSLKEPIGTSLDRRGNVFVADKKSETIHIVKLGGNGIGTLKTDTVLTGPREINISTNDHTRPRLAIAYGSGYIQIFDLFEHDTLPSAPAFPEGNSYLGDCYQNPEGRSEWSGGGIETTI